MIGEPKMPTPGEVAKTPEKESLMEESISKVIEMFKAEGHTMLAISQSDWHVYGCSREDIPEGALDTYSPIDSLDAREKVRTSFREGYSYGDIHAPEEE